MNINLRSINGNWDLGYVLDKHIISSKFIGNNDYGHPVFDTLRPEVGEALYQLKYRSDWSKITPLAQELAISIYPLFDSVGLIIPMPATNVRRRQPVTELAVALGKIVNRPVYDNILIRNSGGQQLKDLTTKDEKILALIGQITVHDGIEGEGIWNAILVDDIFDSGATVEAACEVLRGYRKIGRIYVMALTWK